MDNNEHKQPLATTFDGGKSIPMAIDLDPAAKRKIAAMKRQQERLADAEAYAAMGSKVMKINARAEALIGKQAEKIGIKLIAKGRILANGDEAGHIARELGAYITQLQQSNTPITAADVVALQQVRRDYVKLSMESASMLLESEAAANRGTSGTHVNIPYAAGSSLAVAIGVPAKDTPAKMVE